MVDDIKYEFALCDSGTRRREFLLNSGEQVLVVNEEIQCIRCREIDLEAENNLLPMFKLTSCLGNRYKTGPDPIQMTPARSVQVFLINTTNMDLNHRSTTLDQGRVTTNQTPPDIIPAGQTKHFQLESQGFRTGVEGTVSYRIDGTTNLVIYMDNPYMGLNSYKVYPDGPNADQYDVTKGNGDGANAELIVILSWDSNGVFWIVHDKDS
ncbi:hypothetical protein BDV28DRAFT_145917 [Aspergillus coremiiformis]|uniref:Uncharacterized protein n=1 Tax=Aspergillus coremiiformis TaxID=138285 RepID=A0A5N6ZDK1_9EURO|nr:hypothetical protein BDV28DRAFT_145917 [Aspergillus coremiiformis]